jgi:glucoamylase
MLVEGEAFGGPGMRPGWTHSNKSAIGTAYSTSSPLWFTLWKGIVTEVSYPTIDRPQLRDVQYLITDGKSFFHEEKRDLDFAIERISEGTLGYRCTNSDPAGRYAIVKDVIANPHLACLLQRTRITGPDPAFLDRLHVYALCAPHLEVGGYGNTGYVKTVNGRRLLMARKGPTWMAMGATVPFARTSCGFVGASDGWTDLHDNLTMDWEFETASDGNVALTGDLDVGITKDFTLGIAFGTTEHDAIATLMQSLSLPFDNHLAAYKKQWQTASAGMVDLASHSCDEGGLYRSSCSLLLAHEDKAYAGALIASLTIPWGDVKGDDDTGGYHLVWTRDMVSSVTALVAAGDVHTALRALIFLAVSQHDDGGFAQNFWVNGEAYWNGTQLDEVAFPLTLAWQLHRYGALADFDPFDMIRRAAAFLIRNGPVTQQERWEEASGYSPSTLAANIVALTCASAFFRDRCDAATADFIQDQADYLEDHLEEWTVTATGTLGDVPYYMRILPELAGQENPAEDKEARVLRIANCAPGAADAFPARDVVDGGFLELVRHGIRAPDDPVVLNTLKIVDAVLKVETPLGPSWHRYNHDGYGQQRDGGPFTSYGVGRVWPLLTGERGHYEVAAGRSAEAYLRTMEGLASKTCLLCEQAWDEADMPEMYMRLGEPTGSAMPLMWAHAEYVKLLRSVADGKVFDQVPEVAERYLSRAGKNKKMEAWKFNRRVRFMHAGEMLRVIGEVRFSLRWTSDHWASVHDSASHANSLDIDHVDLSELATTSGMLIEFTFFWLDANRWEGRNYVITVR